MKYTPILAAGLAASVSADDWQSWTDSTTITTTTITPVVCPHKVTQTITKTTDCAEVTSEVYQTTITVESPKTRTVTINANGHTVEFLWDSWTWTPEPAAPTSLPHDCVPQVVTETEFAYVKKAGSTTTVTRSTLFVGADDCAATAVTVTLSESAPTPTWDSGNYGSGNDRKKGDDGSYSSDGGDDSDSNNGDWNTWVAGDDPKFSTAPEGWRVPVSDKIVATDAWKWTVSAATNTKSWAPPVYTKKPDGSYGYDWGSWDGPDASDDPSGPSQPAYPGKNATKPSWNETAGSPASNVTKPIMPLSPDHGCNSAGSRSEWCGGQTVQSNYYEDYYSGNTCTADLTVAYTQLDLDGSLKDVIAINGQVPGPLIECNWGDIIQVTVHNRLTNNGTSFHWHGFRQAGTNNMDGVPGVTECPIAPGQSKTYTFHASSYGTTWYHSHWISQYGDGAYGPIIVHGPATAEYDDDMGVVAIQDTFNVTAAQQNSIIAHTGPQNTVNYLLNGHNTKHDLSGGKHTLWSVEKGKKYLFRFVNSAAQNMFSLSLDNHKMKVIAADFVPITPYETEWLNIGIGQRYDVVIDMDQDVDSYFLRAVTQTGCPSGCDNTGLGNANGIVAYKGVNTAPYYLPTSTTTKTLNDFAICDDEPLASLVPHMAMGAGSQSAFSASASTIPAAAPAGIQTADDGIVFQWFLNNGAININFTQPTLKSLKEGASLNTTLISNPIVLREKKQWVYFVIQNQFFAAHPIHLHGHDFSILGQGSGLFDVSRDLGSLNFVNPMRRDTAMLKGASPNGPAAPSGYTVIGFETDNPGAWLMHCHIIWHVDGGLAIQWIERPDDISHANYVDSQFKDQCAAYTSYERTNPGVKKLSGESGLKKRTFFDEQVAKLNGFQFDGVVRREDAGAKHYLDTRLKRGFGDGYHPRHFGRR